MKEENYYQENTNHQYYTQQPNKTKGNNGSQTYKGAILLIYMISDVHWKSSEHIAILVHEKHLSKINSVDLHLNILLFSIN